MTDQWAITVEEAGQRLGVGRSLAYALARKGSLPTVRLGRRLLVPTEAFEAWQRRQTVNALVATIRDEEAARR